MTIFKTMENSRANASEVLRYEGFFDFLDAVSSGNRIISCPCSKSVFLYPLKDHPIPFPPSFCPPGLSLFPPEGLMKFVRTLSLKSFSIIHFKATWNVMYLPALILCSEQRILWPLFGCWTYFFFFFRHYDFFESFGLLKYYLLFNSVLDAFFSIVYFHNV
jgi:hypothetical protein